MIHAFEKHWEDGRLAFLFSISKAVEDDDSSFFADVFALVLLEICHIFLHFTLF